MYIFWNYTFRVYSQDKLKCLNVVSISRLYSFVFTNPHTFSFITSTVKGNMVRIIQAICSSLRKYLHLSVSIEVFCYSFFFSPFVTLGEPEHICAPQTSHKTAILLFGGLVDLVHDERKE